MAVVAPALAEGTPFLIVDGDAALVHLPAETSGPSHRHTLTQILEHGEMPLSWRTRCGQRGKTWIYRHGLFYRRRACRVCERAE